jgi:hypothetical protein
MKMNLASILPQLRYLSLIFLLSVSSDVVLAEDAAPEARSTSVEQSIADTYVRLEALSSAGADLSRYQMAKALALLDVARREFYMRNYSAIVPEFIAAAQGITLALEQQRVAGMDNPKYTDASPVAPVLWQRIERLKEQLTLQCTGALIAKAEVALLAAENDHYLLGWRAAVGRISLAEQWVAEAENIGSCQ